ncbi:sulfatase [Actinokineospora sp. 24-640]
MGLTVLAFLAAPSDVERLTPREFLRVPVEGLAAVVLLLVLPARARRVVAAIGGAAIGSAVGLKALDIGFDAVLHRPFDLVHDWALFGPALDYVAATGGRPAAIASAVGAVAVVAGMTVLSTVAALRLAGAVVRHRQWALRAVTVLAVAGLTFSAPGPSGEPLASRRTAALVVDHARQVRARLGDRERFAAANGVDRFRDASPHDLLSALRGKDVALVFVESYGRDAVEDPGLAPRVDAALDAGTRRLRAAGFTARSAFLASPTAGGGSWLAHATLLSGLWVDTQRRYRDLVASDRLTLTSAFRRAGWETAGVMPGVTRAWPEAAFFGYARVHAAGDLGYRGPGFGFATMPDQYALSAFEHRERARPGRGPLMAVIPVLSSHAPWSPIPATVGWDEVGDGSVFAAMPSGAVEPRAIWQRDPAQVRTDYVRSIVYSLETLVSYVETYGDDDLVVVFLGDHQPTRLVTGADAGRDVPVTVIARDPAVLARVSAWRWDEGLTPGPLAPVWPMDTFRDRFLTAFGP